MIDRRDFWSEVLALSGSVTPHVIVRVGIFGIWGGVICLLYSYLHFDAGLGVAPYEFVGAVMALLLVLRTNSGYDRWYEGRKLWGGIVNQTRNLSVAGLAYGPNDPQWRDHFLRWTAAFPHLARHSLRGERDLNDISNLLPAAELHELEKANHMPMYGSFRLSQLLASARDRDQMDGFAFMRAEDQRGLLIDHIGACERIIKTPLAKVMSIKVRRFLFLYLMVLPLAIIDRAGVLTPIMTMLVAYPLLSLDQIGIELENPFSKKRLSHLPLDRICKDLETTVLAMGEHARPSQAVLHGWATFDEVRAGTIRNLEPEPVRS